MRVFPNDLIPFVLCISRWFSLVFVACTIFLIASKKFGEEVCMVWFGGASWCRATWYYAVVIISNSSQQSVKSAFHFLHQRLKLLIMLLTNFKRLKKAYMHINFFHSNRIFICNSVSSSPHSFSTYDHLLSFVVVNISLTYSKLLFYFYFAINTISRPLTSHSNACFFCIIWTSDHSWG